MSAKIAVASFISIVLIIFVTVFVIESKFSAARDEYRLKEKAFYIDCITSNGTIERAKYILYCATDGQNIIFDPET